jgi:hypothetical protein
MEQQHFHTESEGANAPVTVGALASSETTEPSDEGALTATIDAETVRVRLEHEVRVRKRRFVLSMACICLYMAPLEIGVFIRKASDWIVYLMDHPWMAVPLLALYLGSAVLTLLSLSNKNARWAARASAGLDDVRLVGPLVDAMKFEDAQTRRLAYNHLTQLLPCLKASDAGLLNQEQRAHLCRILARPTDSILWRDLGDMFRRRPNHLPDFQVAVLKAFEQVGDRRALAVVERLAQGEARTTGRKRVQEAALACLPFLRERVGLEQASQTLLRASSASEPDPKTLLRAAGPDSAERIDQLLHPSSEDALPII